RLGLASPDSVAAENLVRAKRRFIAHRLTIAHPVAEVIKWDIALCRPLDFPQRTERAEPSLASAGIEIKVDAAERESGVIADSDRHQASVRVAIFEFERVNRRAVKKVAKI